MKQRVCELGGRRRGAGPHLNVTEVNQILDRAAAGQQAAIENGVDLTHSFGVKAFELLGQSSLAMAAANEFLDCRKASAARESAQESLQLAQSAVQHSLVSLAERTAASMRVLGFDPQKPATDADRGLAALLRLATGVRESLCQGDGGGPGLDAIFLHQAVHQAIYICASSFAERNSTAN